MNVNSYLFLFVRPKSGCYVSSVETDPAEAKRRWTEKKEGDQRPVFDDDIPDDEMSDQGESQPVHEGPAKTAEVEPLDEDRVIPFEDDSSVAIGVVYTQTPACVA